MGLSPRLYAWILLSTALRYKCNYRGSVNKQRQTTEINCKYIPRPAVSWLQQGSCLLAPGYGYAVDGEILANLLVG